VPTHSRADRRPWLILSASEATALQLAALASLEQGRGIQAATAVLARALRMIDVQLRYIEGFEDGEEPSVRAALRREGFQHAD
jgi:hypothetical protein